MIWLAVLAACGSDPDASGPRWDSDPPLDASPDTDDTDTVDTVDTDTALPYDPLCGGKGPGSFQIGTGGVDNFEAYADDDPVPISESPMGEQWGLTVSLLTEGLDTTGFVTAIATTDNALDDSLHNAMLALQCPRPGPGWVTLHLNFDPDAQKDIAAGLWDGVETTVDIRLIDQSEDEAERVLTVVLQGP